jgi:hypothetical protein
VSTVGLEAAAPLARAATVAAAGKIRSRPSGCVVTVSPGYLRPKSI